MPKITPVDAFAKGQNEPQRNNDYKRDDPKYQSDSASDLKRDPEELRQHEHSGDLHASADPRNLHRAPESDEAEQDHDISEPEVGRRRKSLENTPESARDDDPFDHRVENQKQGERGASGGLHSRFERREDLLNPFHEVPGEKRQGTQKPLLYVAPELPQPDQQSQAGSPREARDVAPRLENQADLGARLDRAVRNLRQRDAEDQQDHEEIQHPLHQPGRDLTGERYPFFARDQVRAHRFPGAAKQHHSRESDRGGGKNPPQAGVFPQRPEHDFPAQRAPDVGRENQHAGEKQPGPIHVTEGCGKLAPGEPGGAPPVHHEDNRPRGREERQSGSQVFFIQMVTAASLSTLWARM